MEIEELNFSEIDEQSSEKYFCSKYLRLFVCVSGKKKMFKVIRKNKYFDYLFETILPYLEKRKENDKDMKFYGREVIDKHTKDSTAIKWQKNMGNLRIYCREIYHNGVLYVLMCKHYFKKTQKNNKEIINIIQSTRKIEFNIEIINRIDKGE